jgi:hypothetical protein
VDGEIYTSSRSALKNGTIALNNETRTDYMNQEQNLAVIRDITVEHSTDKGIAQSFSKPVQVNDDRWFMNGCPDAGPGMAFDSKGRLHIAWFTGSETGADGQGFYYASSDDLTMSLLGDKMLVEQRSVYDQFGEYWFSDILQRR